VSYSSDVAQEIAMTCSQVRSLLVALQDGELSRSQEDLVSAHLAGCPACAAHLERLEATTPAAPVIVLDDARRHDLHRAIERALDAADPTLEPAPRTWRDLFSSEVPVPRGLVILYAAALLLAIGWAARGSVVTEPTPTVAAQAPADAAPTVAVQLHRPAAYTPRDGWF